MFAGTLFLLLGIATLTTPLWASGGAQQPVAFAAVSGAVMLVFGCVLAFGRLGRVIDRRQRKITTWWGLALPFRKQELPLKTQEYALNEFSRLSISCEVRRSRHATCVVYPVRLEGKRDSIAFEEAVDYKVARRNAEELAAFMGLPLTDLALKDDAAIVCDASDRQEPPRNGSNGAK
jgi:hypothetical protein